MAEKPAGCKAVSGHKSVHSWRGNQREAKGLGLGASGLCGNPRPHTDSVMHRCPSSRDEGTGEPHTDSVIHRCPPSRDEGTGEPQQGRGPGTGRPAHPPFSVAKIRELPVNQVNTTEGILPTRAPHWPRRSRERGWVTGEKRWLPPWGGEIVFTSGSGRCCSGLWGPRT